MANAPGGDNQGTSTRPYLLRALHDWCTDNGFTPYVAVHVDSSVQVPMEYVKNNEIVLNVGFEATAGLQMGNEFIEFKARFGGVSREIRVPVDHVVAIYARENGQGMAFPVPTEPSSAGNAPAVGAPQPAVPRGLRLASAGVEDAQPAHAARGESAPESSPAPTGAPGTEPPPPEPSGPGGGRPALKRIK